MNCPHQAVLIVTRAVRGTSSSLAKKRLALRCGQAADHDGEHHDKRHGKQWQDRGNTITHLFEHEES